MRSAFHMALGLPGSGARAGMITVLPVPGARPRHVRPGLTLAAVQSGAARLRGWAIDAHARRAWTAEATLLERAAMLDDLTDTRDLAAVRRCAEGLADAPLWAALLTAQVVSDLAAGLDRPAGPRPVAAPRSGPPWLRLSPALPAPRLAHASHRAGPGRV